MDFCTDTDIFLNKKHSSLTKADIYCLAEEGG